MPRKKKFVSPVDKIIDVELKRKYLPFQVNEGARTPTRDSKQNNLVVHIKNQFGSGENDDLYRQIIMDEKNKLIEKIMKARKKKNDR